MSEVRNLSYLVLGVSDFDAWESFATEVVGMQVGDRTNDSMKLRMDDLAYRIVLEHDPSDDIRAAGWQVDDEDSLMERGLCTEQLSLPVRVVSRRELRQLLMTHFPVLRF